MPNLTRSIVTLSATAIAAVGGLSYAAFWPRSQWFVPVHFRGPIDGVRPRIALSFDDGPHPEATPAVVDILAVHDVPGAFFLIGENAQAHPALVSHLDRQGHLLGNHSFSHDWGGLFHQTGYWQNQLRRTDEAIAQASGKRPRLFRPPMGFKHPFLAKAVRRGDYEVVTWTRRGRDGWPTGVKPILDRLVEPASAGDVLTLHDGEDRHIHRDFQPMLDALGPMIDQLRQRGFKFTRLDELLGLEPYRV